MNARTAALIERLTDLAARAREAKGALRGEVRAARLAGVTEADVVRATGLARATVRAWTAQARDGR